MIFCNVIGRLNASFLEKRRSGPPHHFNSIFFLPLKIFYPQNKHCGRFHHPNRSIPPRFLLRSANVPPSNNLNSVGCGVSQFKVIIVVFWCNDRASTILIRLCFGTYVIKIIEVRPNTYQIRTIYQHISICILQYAIGIQNITAGGRRPHSSSSSAQQQAQHGAGESNSNSQKPR